LAKPNGKHSNPYNNRTFTKGLLKLQSPYLFKSELVNASPTLVIGKQQNCFSYFKGY